MPPFFVLARTEPRQPWAVVSKPLPTAAEAAPIVQATLAAQPGARLVVVDVLRSFQASVQVTQDAVAVADP